MHSIFPNNENINNEFKKQIPKRMETLPSNFRRPSLNVKQPRTSRFNSLPLHVELSSIREEDKFRKIQSRRHTVGSTVSIDTDTKNLYYNDTKKLIQPISNLLDYFINAEAGSPIENALLSFKAQWNSIKAYASGRRTIGLHTMKDTSSSVASQERSADLVDKLVQITQCCWLGGECVIRLLMKSNIVEKVLTGLRRDSFPINVTISILEFIGELCRCQKDVQSHLAAMETIDILINCMDDTRTRIQQAAVSSLMLLLCNNAENQELALLDIDFLLQKLNSLNDANFSSVWYPYNPVEEIKIMLDIIPPEHFT